MSAYASHVLRGDLEMVCAAVEQDASALKFARKAIREHRDVVLRTLAKGVHMRATWPSGLVLRPPFL